MDERATLRQDGAAIKRLRRERGIKPADLASQVQITGTSLANVEGLWRQASFELLYRIAQALGVDVDRVLSDAGRDELSVEASR